jgi:predicted N-acetyltransferase YhbS
MMLGHTGFYGVVAELDGAVVGSNFLDERGAVFGLGPITVAPERWDHGVGRALMEHTLRRAAERRAPGVRLLQSAYHTRSLALYASLGFAVRAHVACLQGPPVRASVPGYEVRAATAADRHACDVVCSRVHGHDRSAEVADAIAQGSTLVVEHDGRVTGYSTALAFFGHTVGESDEDMKALIAAARGFGGPGILVPAGNVPLMRFCLDNGLKVVELLNLMTIGLYNEPTGSYLPSILY